MVVIKIIMSVIVFFTVSLNTSAAVCLLKRKHRNNYVILCLNLVLNDLLQSIAGCLPTLFFHTSLINDLTLCKISAFFISFSAFTTITLLSGVALSRMVLLYVPFLTNRVKYKTLFKKVGPLSWVYAFFWSVLPLMGLSSYTLEATHSRCLVNWFPVTTPYKVYLVLLVIFCFVIPNFIILTSCLFTASVMRKKFSYFEHTYGGENLETKKFKEKEKKAFSSLTFMVLSFTTCWTPYAIVGILSAFTSLRLPIWLLETAALLAKASTLVNPIIYALKDNLFRFIFKKIKL